MASKKCEDEEDDDAVMDEIWGFSGGANKKPNTKMIADVEEDDEDSSKPASKEPKKARVQREKKQPGPKRDIGNVALDSAPGSTMSLSLAGPPQKLRKTQADKEAAALSKELDKAEAVILAVNQHLQALSNNATVSSLVPKATRAAVDKVNGRLTTELVVTYCANWTAGGPPTRGIQVLEKLKEAQAKMNVVAPLVDALHGDASTADASTLFQCIAAARTAGVQVASVATEIMVARSVSMAAANKDWDKFFELLNPESEIVDQGVRVFVSGPDAMENGLQHCASMQACSIVKVVSDFLLTGESEKQPDAKECAVSDLKHFLDKVTFKKVTLPPELLAELGHLCVLCSAQAHDIDDVRQARTSLESSKATGHFWKALALFPAGQFLMSAAAKVIEDHETSNTMKVEIEALRVLSSTLKAVTADALIKEICGL